jgi:hypothetical protein
MAAPLFQAHSQIVCRVFSRKSPAFRVKRGTNRTEIVTRKNILWFPTNNAWNTVISTLHSRNFNHRLVIFPPLIVFYTVIPGYRFSPHSRIPIWHTLHTQAKFFSSYQAYPVSPGPAQCYKWFPYTRFFPGIHWTPRPVPTPIYSGIPRPTRACFVNIH